jgi:hypothetical protein
LVPSKNKRKVSHPCLINGVRDDDNYWIGIIVNTVRISLFVSPHLTGAYSRFAAQRLGAATIMNSC